MADSVLTEIADGCAAVTLNRPEARNALSGALIDALGDAIATVGREVEAGRVRVMVLGGVGKAFCAGMDLKAVMSDPQGMKAMLYGLARVMSDIRELAIPTIARVQGAAVGGGCGLMVAPDFTVTHPEARIGYPEVSLGLCPAVVAPWLIRKIGAGRARAMLLAGRTVGGEEGYRLGLVTHLTERGRLEAETTDLARRLSDGSPQALSTTKRWLNEIEGTVEEAAALRGADLSAEVLAGAEAQARLRARFGAD